MSSGVLNKLSPAEFTDLQSVFWPTIESFQKRIHPHLARTIHAWEGIFTQMVEGSKEAGRYLAANHMSDRELSQTQQNAGSNGEPFWETASQRLRQELDDSVNLLDVGRGFHAHRLRGHQEEALTRQFRSDYYTGFSLGPTVTDNQQ